MTDQDKKDIAEIVSKVLDQHSGCPNGIDSETAETLKNFAKAIQTGQKTAIKAFVTLAIGALCAALIAGAKELLKK